MKKTYLYLIALLFLPCFIACDGDVKGTVYHEDDIEKNTGNKVSNGFTFQSSAYNHEMAAEDEGKIYVPIIRSDRTLSTVDVAFSNSYVIDKNEKGEDVTERRLEGRFVAKDGVVFTLDTPSVTFAEGADRADVVISYNSVEDLSVTDPYSTVLAIVGGTVVTEGFTTVSMVVQRKLTWDEIGECKFYTGLGNLYSPDTVAKYGYAIPMPIEKAREGDIFRIVNPYKKLNSQNDGDNLVVVFTDEQNTDGFRKVRYKSFSTGYAMDGDPDMICWANYVAKYHTELCYYIPPGEVDDNYKDPDDEDDVNAHMIGLGTIYANESMSAVYPGVFPDGYTRPMVVYLPDDFAL